MKRKAIYLIVLISLIIAIFKIYSFYPIERNIAKINIEAQQAGSSDRYIITNKSQKTYKQQSHSANASGQITYEEFIVNESLVAINTDAIPYLKYVRETDENKAKLDATLEKWELQSLPSDKEVRYYKIGNILEKVYVYNNQQNRPSVSNPYGNSGRILATSRTIAVYDRSTQKNLTASEAWILAHERTLSKSGLEDYSKARIDKVQKAIWKLKGATNFEENFGTNDVAEKVANNLYQEAIWMQEAADRRNELSQPIIDNKENQYVSENAGAVSYNETTKEFLVGPFSINYVRVAHKPLEGGLSEMISVEEGNGNLIIYSGIVGANVYGLVNGKEQLLTDWEFVYPDVSVTNGTVVRNAIKAAGEYGDSDDNIYPYPNEEFYIKFLNPNNSIEALTKLEFDLQTLNAEGTVKELKGTYSNVNWVVGENWKSQVTRPSYTQNEPIWVSSGYYKDDGFGNKVWVDTSHWKDNWVTYPTLYKYTYSAYVEDKQVSRPNAATLYQIQNAKIYSKVESVKIKVGKKNSGYKYSDYCIPLTMDIGGTVWVDGTEQLEAQGKVNGIKNNGEEVKPGITVKLYDVNNNLIDTAVTNNNGKYLFNYVQIGPRYYVEFEYDWMKYKATTELCTTSGKGSVEDFTNNPENYLNSSHASENVQKRKDFNQKFYEITTDKGIGKDGNKKTDINYTYENNLNPYYQESTVQEFKEVVVTKECDVLLPLQNQFTILEGGNKFFPIGVGSQGSCAITTTNKDEDLNYLYESGSFMKVQEYLKNINLGLVERCPADFAVKADVKSTTFTLEEYSSNQNTGFNLKEKSNFNISERKDEYWNREYQQEIEARLYDWRKDFEEGGIEVTDEDETQLYVLYEITIKNQSPLISGYITELSNYYDKEYFYPVNNDSSSLNFYSANSSFKEKTMEFMSYPSFVMKDGEIIKQVNWKSTSKFGDGNATELNKMYTESLNDILLAPNETLSVFVYYKVEREEINKDTPTEYRYGEYIILDNEDKGKRNIFEINAYRALDYVEKDKYNMSTSSIGGSRVDIDSNPGNIDGDKKHSENINAFENYEDDIDAAPRFRVILKEFSGKEISGYVWEDNRNVKLANNQWIGNGKFDDGETPINNVLVELIRLQYNPDTNEYQEVKFSEKYEKYVDSKNNYIKENYGAQYENGEISLIKIKRRTGPQDNNESLLDTPAFIENGQYRFTNLIESGKYKVRFTYGDLEQLSTDNSGIIYNGHDYKSTEFKGFFEQDIDSADINNVNALVNTQIEILTSDAKYNDYASTLVQKFKETDNKIIINNFIQVLDGNIISNKIETLKTSGKESKVLVLLVNRSLRNIGNILKDALDNDIRVIVVATNNVASNEFNVISGDKSVIFYNTLDTAESVDIVYNRILNRVLDVKVFTNEDNHTTDFLENMTTINGEVYGRSDVMLKSQTIDYNMAKILEVEDIRRLPSGEEKTERLKKLADFKMTAESYSVGITFDDNDNLKTINLGLQRIPESSLELSEKVDNIVVKLSNGQTIIDRKNNITTNLQHFINESYNIYMDEEIMQGATIEVLYKINISNVGEVDNLYTYLQYYPFEVKQKIYQKLIGNNNTYNEQQLDEILKTSVPIKVNKLHNYYDNLIFRAEENNRQDITLNNVVYQESSGYVLPSRDEFNNLILQDMSTTDARVVWSQIFEKNDLQVLDRDNVSKYNTVITNNLNVFDLYPFESTEVKDKRETSSISTYIKLSKELGAQDFDSKDSLIYKNFSEIIETYSITGRRDKDSSVGNFVPTNDFSTNLTDEDDSDMAEVVKILVPFGENKLVRYSIYIMSLMIIVCGIVFIKKKVL